MNKQDYVQACEQFHNDLNQWLYDNNVDPKVALGVFIRFVAKILADFVNPDEEDYRVIFGEIKHGVELFKQRRVA